MAANTKKPTGSFLTRKYGPLPMWAWMGLSLGVLLAISMWQSNKTPQTNTAPAATPSGVSYTNLPPQFIDADHTEINYPPAGGRDSPTIPTGDEYNKIFDAGFQPGHKSGFDDGHKAGFDSGFDAGHKSAWNDAYDKGYQAALKR